MSSSWYLTLALLLHDMSPDGSTYAEHAAVVSAVGYKNPTNQIFKYNVRSSGYSLVACPGRRIILAASSALVLSASSLPHRPPAGLHPPPQPHALAYLPTVLR